MALSCTLNKNLSRADFCGYSLRSVSMIYLANYSDATATLDTDGYTVKSVTGTWYSIDPAKESASYEDSLVIGGNGSKYRTHSITFSFNGSYSAEMAEVIDSLSLGKFIAVLALSDGSNIMLGRVTGLEASAASSLSEASADGNQGLTITLEANVTEAALVVSEEAMETIKTSVKG